MASRAGGKKLKLILTRGAGREEVALTYACLSARVRTGSIVQQRCHQQRFAHVFKRCPCGQEPSTVNFPRGRGEYLGQWVHFVKSRLQGITVFCRLHIIGAPVEHYIDTLLKVRL